LRPPLPIGRQRHRFGEGPFARLVMPALPDKPGLYPWQQDEVVVYVGQTRTPLRKSLGPNGYATISGCNTLAPPTVSIRETSFFHQEHCTQN
jgi:hypothetical protein